LDSCQQWRSVRAHLADCPRLRARTEATSESEESDRRPNALRQHRPWTKRASGCSRPIWEAGKVGAGNTKVGSKSIRGGLYCVARSQLVNCAPSPAPPSPSPTRAHFAGRAARRYQLTLLLLTALSQWKATDLSAALPGTWGKSCFQMILLQPMPRAQG